ncbi:uncharacterized protein MELLADRAFT_92318 [Melampsora larici-populina 98AG31]|uniref:OTU domain-containing protein n=1 Tax=Melampsora larici-populina (strain 98AG31 / pathotype 3-4-7) TaxID=747676 RepID=F4R968_MELLP|nr:uncharacterized protein MELLADRAFT_92318 [Melampsora larici-populina 98AG31]EGG10930.1 hypothetical protein MELLADRAFT_92318 [Melampsora larici-populina 98AG31]
MHPNVTNNTCESGESLTTIRHRSNLLSVFDRSQALAEIHQVLNKYQIPHLPESSQDTLGKANLLLRPKVSQAQNIPITGTETRENKDMALVQVLPKNKRRKIKTTSVTLPVPVQHFDPVQEFDNIPQLPASKHVEGTDTGLPKPLPVITNFELHSTVTECGAHHLEFNPTAAQPQKKRKKVRTTTAKFPVPDLESDPFQDLDHIPQLPSSQHFKGTDSVIAKSPNLDVEDLKLMNTAQGSGCSSQLPSPDQIFHTLPDSNIQTLSPAELDCDHDLDGLASCILSPNRANQEQQANLPANNSDHPFPIHLRKTNTISTKPTILPRLVDYDSEPSFSTNVSQASPPLTPLNDCLPDPVLLPTQPPDSLTQETTPLLASPVAALDEEDKSFQLESLLPSRNPCNTPPAPAPAPVSVPSPVAIPITRTRSGAEGRVTRKPPSPLRRSTRHKLDTSSAGTRRYTRNQMAKKADQVPQDDRVPLWLHEYLPSVQDPLSDGHCGYRAIAMSLGRTEDDWLVVRNELIAELESKADFYESHLKTRKRGDGGVAEHVEAIKTRRKEVLNDPSLWLDSARMMYIIATAYNRPFCVYSKGHKDENFTAFPLDCPANDYSPIFVCYDRQGAHFMSISFSSPLFTIPIPQPWTEWYNLASPEAADWTQKFQPQINFFTHRIIPSIVAERPLLNPHNKPVEVLSSSDEGSM